MKSRWPAAVIFVCLVTLSQIALAHDLASLLVGEWKQTGVVQKYAASGVLNRRAPHGVAVFTRGGFFAFTLNATQFFGSIHLKGAPVHAHEWYPMECCARNDCMPATGVEGGERGGMTVIVGDLRVGIPESVTPRQSPDGRVHVCFRAHTDHTDGSVTIVPVCLFLPPQA